MDPEPSAGLIDRAIVAAYDAGIEPMLIVTKTDLKPSRELDLANQVNQSALDAVQADLRATSASITQFASFAAVPGLITPALTLLARLLRRRPR